MTMETLKKTWENEYIQTGIMIIVIIVVVFGLWYGTQIVLNTRYPALAVASGSMCKSYGIRCDGWSHPFQETLHVGDLILVQGTSADEIKASLYPHGDIIVFRRGGELIVHRAIAKENRSGQWYFQTKGDGNDGPDSTKPNVPEDKVIGEVILRVPWIGHIALFMRNSSGVYLITVLIVVLIIVEFIIPIFFSSGKDKIQ